MRLYRHNPGADDPDVIEAEGAATVGEALEVREGTTVVLLEDTDEPLSLNGAVESMLSDRAHVFVGQHERVLATVGFVEKSIEKEFSASTRVKRVFEWAVGKHGFDLSEVDAAEHTLALNPSERIPPEDVHLGSLDAETPGRVSFELVPKKRFEG